MIGLNFPADMRLDPQFGALLGARWLRVVLLPNVDLTPWIQDAHARGLKVLGVIARESFQFNADYAATAKMYGERYGLEIDALQVGNESDHESPSSWTMEPSDLNALLAEINIYFPSSVTIVGPGLVSGNPHYLDGVDLDLVDAIAVHPYGRHPSEGGWGETPGNFGNFEELIDAYAYHWKRVWITEVGVSTTQVSEEFQARYCRDSLIELMSLRDVDQVMWFCADDLMVPEFGLYGTENNPKPAAAAFMRAASAQPEPTVTVKAIDVSSHQPRDLSALIAQHQAKHVIPHLYIPGESPPFAHSAAQVASAKANGCTVGGYVWCFRSFDPIKTIDDIITRCASIDLVLPLLWLDCETYEEDGVVLDPGPDAEWLARAVDHSERVYGMKCGIYTGIWWIDGHFPGGQAGFADFARLPIWLSQYDHNSDINSTRLPLGWTQAAAKQYSADGIDLNSIRPEYTVYAGSEPPPPPDPCEHFRQQLTTWRDRRPYKAPTKKQLTALLS